ncbi:MAG: ATP-binding cassette domain-containing protein [bacterium]|nr:ATP-binding cassette domain-containing protein [bacterium]
MPNEPLLRLRGWSLVRRDPGGERVLLRDVDLDVPAGCWLAVAGGNGSGKSSLLKYLAGDESPVADRVALVAQDPDEQLVTGTVVEELALGHPVSPGDAELAAAGLAGLGDRDPRVLSAGQKQRLALAAALGQEPELLLCDEPTALQDPAQAAWMLDRLEGWLRVGNRALVTATCDRAEALRAHELAVIDAGRIVRLGPPAELLRDPLVDALLPTAPPPAGPRPEPSSTATVLATSGLSFGDGRDGPSCAPPDLRVRAGERVGLTGPNGCGKSTLLAACVGLLRPRTGTVHLGDERLYQRSARDLEHGRAALAPQFPEYMFTAPTVRQEIAVDPTLAATDPAALLARLGLPADCLAANPHALSTGQRRRLALGLVLRSGRPLLALDEPTAALDRAGRRTVLDLLAELDDTAGLLVASHDRAFLAAAGCRIIDLPG